MDKNKSLKYLILIILAPVLGSIIIFSSAYFYVNDEIKILKTEIKGLYRINQIQDIVFEMQRLRGLLNISIQDKNSIDAVKKTKSHILKDIEKIKSELSLNKHTWAVKQHLVKHLNNINKHLIHEIDFAHLSKLIKESLLLIKYISHRSKLVLDSRFESYILIDTIVSILPDLIEYNGQVRGISSSIKDKLTKETRHKLLTQLSKIEDRMIKCNFNMNQLSNSSNHSVITSAYKNMLNAQNSLISFTTNKILTQDKIMVNANDIFRLNTNNIEFIASLYETNSNVLKKLLNLYIQEKKDVQLIIILIAITAILFILFINLIFYNKNNAFIKQIELLSVTDAMTTLFNRRYFDNIFKKQQRIQQRAKKNLIFIMMDIDHFKQYNDTYGHQAGDDALIAVATSLKDTLRRPDDLVFRLGGEEFGVLCNSMNEKEAYDFAEKLRKNIQNLKIEHKGNSASNFVTISMGLVIIEPDFKCEMNNIYKYTDEALYKAKQNGRNQVSIYDMTIIEKVSK